MSKIYRNERQSPTISSMIEWFHRAKPAATQKDAMVQMGVHFEEVGEMLECITGNTLIASINVIAALKAIQDLAEHIKANPDDYAVMQDDRIDMLDALCDQLVTATGTGVFLDMNIEDAIEHVNESNWSKFIDGRPTFTEQGKIAKGPSYFKPDLTKYV